MDLFRPYMRHSDGGPIRWTVSSKGVATQVRNRGKGETESPPHEQAPFPKQKFKELAHYIAKSTFFRLESFTKKRIPGWHMHVITVTGRNFELAFQQNHQPTPKDVKLHAMDVIDGIEGRVDAIVESLQWKEVPTAAKG